MYWIDAAIVMAHHDLATERFDTMCTALADTHLGPTKVSRVEKRRPGSQATTHRTDQPSQPKPRKKKKKKKPKKQVVWLKSNGARV